MKIKIGFVGYSEGLLITKIWETTSFKKSKETRIANAVLELYRYAEKENINIIEITTVKEEKDVI